MHHTNDVLQARANVKKQQIQGRLWSRETIDVLVFVVLVHGLVVQTPCHKAFALAIVGMSGQIHVDFLRLL